MRCKAIAAVLFTAVLCVAAVSNAFSQASQYPFNGHVQGKFATDKSVGLVPKGARTVPNWSSSFTFEGQIFPYTMVGTSPFSTTTTTTVQPVIIPIKFVFADGSSLDGGSKIANTLGSPNFQPSTYTSSTTATQFGDAVQRAEFYASVQNNDWHTMLAAPQVLPTQVINVPANQATDFLDPFTATRTEVALMSASWFSSKLQNLIASLHIAPNTLPIVATYNTFLYVHDLNNCCILGFHGATQSRNGNGSQQVQTYIYAAWSDTEIFVTPVKDILPMSHEISEWMNDPFVNNATPPWEFPGNLGCQANLETGDPVEVLPNSSFPVTINGFTYHPQTEALLQWFTRESPSSAIDGAYSYPDTTALTSPSQPCQ
jgi:hypothetical protein